MKKSKKISILVLTGILALAFNVQEAHATGTYWQTETVDSNMSCEHAVYGYRGTSIALDGNDHPHISYIGPDYELMYAYYNGSSWNTEEVDWGRICTIVLDSNDNPHISYYQGQYAIRHAYFDGTSWHTEDVGFSDFGGYPSMDLDSNDNPHISYYRHDDDRVMYTYYDGTSWHDKTVDYLVNDAVRTLSLALDSDDNPHITYYLVIDDDLEYAYLTPSGWVWNQIDYNAGEDSSIALDRNDNPHISYIGNDWEELIYFHDYEWETVDNFGHMEWGGYTSLALDSGDNPHITYYDGAKDDLKYAYYRDYWHIETVDSANDVGLYTSLVLDSGDYPHISYCDGTNCNLKYACLACTLTITTTTSGTTEPNVGIYTYVAGSYVEVTAIPETCYEFDHWELDEEDVGSDNPYSVVMDGNHTLHAVFVQVEYDLTITTTGHGTTDPAPGTHAYLCGSSAEVTAITDCKFVRWRLDGNDVGSENPYYVLMDSDHTLHAVFFRAKACFPAPADGAQDAATDVILSWAPGACAADVNGHDIYFGTDFNDVNDANSSWPVASGPNDPNVYKGRQDANSYDPCGLQLGTIYYWRIDEVNDSCIWKGNIWEFTVNHLVVDDFEDYNDVTNPLWNTWFDGLYNYTGSWVDLGTEPCEPVHGGKQSMIFDYNNSYDWGAGYYSEIVAATADLDVSSDWSGLGVKALTLYFYGDPNNDANDTEQMYVGLEDSNVAGTYGEVRYGDYGEDMNDIKIAKWQEWNIDLQDFNDAGVDLNDVNNVYIGFGDRGNQEVPGGVGVVYFDDIRLYIRRCLAEYQPEGDITGDCKLNSEDLGIMVDEWLKLGDDNLADLYKDEDDIINLKDYAILANHWLEEQPWWPPE